MQQAFGLALLRGMGYDPDKHKTKPIWHDKPRDNLLGLGAKALLPSEKMALKRPKGEEKNEKSEKEQSCMQLRGSALSNQCYVLVVASGS
eukprot:Skav213732  [mRNA]  locus=scaffold2563:323198:323881:+ [translate_table: standard]